MVIFRPSVIIKSENIDTALASMRFLDQHLNLTNYVAHGAGFAVTSNRGS
jgi:hypothetical protein